MIIFAFIAIGLILILVVHSVISERQANRKRAANKIVLPDIFPQYTATNEAETATEEEEHTMSQPNKEDDDTALLEDKSELDKFVFFSTKTTGVNPGYQSIEIAISDATGKVLLHSRMKPSIVVEPNAFREHGISFSALKKAANLQALMLEISPLVNGKILLAFDIEYEIKGLQNSAAAGKFEIQLPSQQISVQKYAQQTFKLSKKPTLNELCFALGLEQVDPNDTVKVAQTIAHIYRKLYVLNKMRDGQAFEHLSNVQPALLSKISAESLLELKLNDQHQIDVFVPSQLSNPDALDSLPLAQLDKDASAEYHSTLATGGQFNLSIKPERPLPKIHLDILTSEQIRAEQAKQKQQACDHLREQLMLPNTLPSDHVYKLPLRIESGDLEGELLTLDFAIGEQLSIRNIHIDDFLDGEHKLKVRDKTGDFIGYQALTDDWLEIAKYIVNGHEALLVLTKILPEEVEVKLQEVAQGVIEEQESTTPECGREQDQ